MTTGNEKELRVDYDDSLLDVIDKANEILRTVGWVFEDDEQEHDGFEIYTLKEFKP